MYANNGLKGLNNLGNSCFANSGMQILSNTYELNDALDARLKRHHFPNKNNASDQILYEWNKLRAQLWDNSEQQELNIHTNGRIRSKPITPTDFINCLYQSAKNHNNNVDVFQNNMQNDMGELISFVLDQIHKSIKLKCKNERVTRSRPPIISNPILKQVCESQPENEYSEIYELFYFLTKSSIYMQSKSDNNARKISDTQELNCVIYLDIAPSLYECLNLYTNPEWIDGYYYEAKNIRTRVVKQLLFKTLPRILTICLKRLQFSAERGDFYKSTCLVDFPENLNMQNYCSHENINLNQSFYKYQLYGIGNHYDDGRGGGHYTSIIKNANMKWYEYNDECVYQIDSNKIVTANAYCLFYRNIVDPIVS